MTKTTKFIIATGDCETDPFEYLLTPTPFVWGFYSEAEGYVHFWGAGKTREEQQKSCCDQFLSFLAGLDKPHMIYMHNGGKFDFIFLLDCFEGAIKIVNGRILEARIGIHVLRDSYAAIPIRLGAYKKDDIDYQKLHYTERQKNKSEILHYLGGDVRYLFEMVVAFRKEFGNVLTIGTAAMRALSEHHVFEVFNQTQDEFFRQFYYGGRNQCFNTGILAGTWKVYDVNSMYPSCMLDMQHPVGSNYSENTTLSNDTDFVIVKGRNYGGLLYRHERGFLDFTHPGGIFYATGHELRAALDTGTFEIERIINAYTCSQRTTFDLFVNHWYEKRLAAKNAKEDLLVLFYKLILNSGYGKFCLSPDNFKDWEVTDYQSVLDPDVWTPEFEFGDIIIWSKPASQTKYYNVATGASITGAARSQLLRGLAKATRPVYCDTDSIICEHLDCDTDGSRLGAWKLESEGDEICIAGKKLYALYANGSVVLDDKGNPKQASKGARLTADQIRNAAEGGVEIFENPVPAFKLNGDHQFIKRRIQKTAFNVKPFGYGKK